MADERQVRDHWRVVIVVAALTAAIAACPAAAAGVAPNPRHQHVRLGFDKTEPGKWVSHGVPVQRATNARRAQPTVIYSVALPRLDRTESLRIRAVVAISRCNETDRRAGGGPHEGNLRSPCELAHDPYGLAGHGEYDPRIAARAYIGSRPSDLDHGVGHWEAQRCTRPRHHCPIVIRTGVDAPSQSQHRVYLNLAVVAFNPKARVGRRGRPVDVVELDANCRHHDYNPDADGDGDPTDDSTFCAPVMGGASSDTRGELQVIRLGRGHAAPRVRSTRSLIHRHLRVSAVAPGSARAPRPRVVLRQRIRHLRPGDVVDAAAAFHLRDHAGGGYVFRHFARGLLILSASPGAVQPRKASRSADRWLSGSSGTNCPHGAGCEIEKAGAIVVPRGAPGTMWVSYVGSAVDSGGVNGATTDVTGGHLSVAVYRAHMGR